MQKAGVPSIHYHAAMENQARADAQRRWTMDRVRVIVATIAFGMGINKPDVRYVCLSPLFAIYFANAI